jgi:flagellar basal body-associated protein FliL
MNMKRALLMAALMCFVSFAVYSQDPGISDADKPVMVLLSEEDGSPEDNSGIYIAPPPPPLLTYELPSFSFMTKDEDPHFVKMSIALGYEKNDELAEELKRRKDEMRHIVNLIAKEQCYDDLNSMKGKIMFAEDIKAHINLRLISGKIKEVYFKEFIIN